MAEEVTATLIVSFGEITVATSNNAFLIIAVDDRVDGLNSGRGTFFTGQDIGFLVYKSNRVGIVKNFTSTGRINQVGTGTREITEIRTFSNSTSASLSFPAQGGFAHVWLGKKGGNLTLKNQKELTLGDKFTGVLEVTYTTSFTEFLLKDLPAEINDSSIYTIVVAAVGEVI